MRSLQEEGERSHFSEEPTDGTDAGRRRARIDVHICGVDVSAVRPLTLFILSALHPSVRESPVASPCVRSCRRGRRLKIKTLSGYRLPDRKFNGRRDKSVFAPTSLSLSPLVQPLVLKKKEKKKEKMFTFVVRRRRAINGSSLNSETLEKRR